MRKYRIDKHKIEEQENKNTKKVREREFRKSSNKFNRGAKIVT